MTITGTIESIEYRNTAGHEKKVVTLCKNIAKKEFNPSLTYVSLKEHVDIELDSTEYVDGVVTGTITDIKTEGEGVWERKVVTVIPDHRQRIFVEFRGKKMKALEAFNIEDEISIEIMFEGKVSKNSGLNYNNLVAVSACKTYRYEKL